MNSRLTTTLALASLSLLIGCGPPNYVVMTDDMAPALEQGDIVAIDMNAYDEATPERGDMVAYQAPEDSEDRARMGRVVAVEGQTVSVEGGGLKVDGNTVDAQWADEEVPYEIDAVQVPEGHVYILGDNHDEARDSHVFGTVPVDSLVGKITDVQKAP